MSFFIDDFEVGGSKTFIIAELSANHAGSLERALEAIAIAKNAGADAVKIQTYTAESLTISSDHPSFFISNGTIWDGQTLFDLYTKAQTPHSWIKPIFEEAKRLGMCCFSSPFDYEAIDILEDNDCPAYKIASPEILHVDLIRYAARTKKPIILSTGIASWSDVDRAIDIIRSVGNNKIGLLKCTAEYPAPYNKANLATIRNFAEKYGVIPGLSDHTLGSVVPVISVAEGAKIIEKHFDPYPSTGSVDSAFSLNPSEFAQMVRDVRIAEVVVGESKLKPEIPLDVPRGPVGRSLYVVKDIEIGESINHDNVRAIRPGFGVHPVLLEEILGKKIITRLEKGTPITQDIIERYVK
jgi:pseudaminic acid synthase